MGVVLLAWACTFGLSPAVTGEVPGRDSEAISAFLTTSYQFTSPLSRDAALKGGVQPIQGWPFLAKLRRHRLYSFPTSMGTPFTFSVVAVDDQGIVTLLDEARGFNSILAAESIGARNLAEALELAQTFLRIQNFAVHKTEQLDLGVRVIGGVEDIDYPEGPAGHLQREKIAKEFQIAPPRVETLREVYSYVLYAWEPVGGALTRHEVRVNEAGVLDYRVEVLAQWIGKYETGH